MWCRCAQGPGYVALYLARRRRAEAHQNCIIANGKARDIEKALGFPQVGGQGRWPSLPCAQSMNVSNAFYGLLSEHMLSPVTSMMVAG